MITPYRKGYNFERRVVKYFENKGYTVIRQGKSKFPDLWLLKSGEIPIAVECKVNKYLNKTEKVLAIALINKDFVFSVAYRDNRELKFWDGKVDKIV